MKRRIRKVPATTNNLTKAIINFLIDKGHYAFRVNNGSIFDPKRKVFRRKGANDPALSDVMGVLRPSGLFLAIEVKNAATGDKPKSAQKLFERQVRECGGIHYFAKRFDDFKAWYNLTIYDESDASEPNKRLDELDSLFERQS